MESLIGKPLAIIPDARYKGQHADEAVSRLLMISRQDSPDVRRKNKSDNPGVNSRLANGTWQQDGFPRSLALAGAETYCSYGAAFNGVSDDAETGAGPNTSGWSYPGSCSQMPACLNQ